MLAGKHGRASKAYHGLLIGIIKTRTLVFSKNFQFKDSSERFGRGLAGVGNVEALNYCLTNLHVRQTLQENVNPRSLILSGLSLNRLGTVLGRFRLLLCNIKLFRRSHASFCGVPSSLASGDRQYLSLLGHLSKLFPKHNGGSYTHRECDSGNQESPSGIAEGGDLKDTRLFFPDNPRGQGIVDHLYGDGIAFLCLIISAQIVGGWRRDVLGNDG